MATPDKNLLPDDEEARAAAIEERLERLRRLQGWSSDTVNVSADEVKAMAGALEGQRKKAREARTKLVLTYALPGKREEVAEITEDSYDIGSGENAKLRVLHPSIGARHLRISRDTEGYRVRDMNSPTGTWVNEQRIPLSSAIVDGDTVRCGDITFTVAIVTGEAAPAATPKPLPPPPASNATMMVSAASLGLPSSAPAQRVPDAPMRPAAPAVKRTPRLASHSSMPAVRAGPPRAYVIYVDADGKDSEAEIPRDRPLVVGRRSTADLRMTDNGISSMHAAFEWVDGELTVRDLGSTNGTWVHGERVPKAVIVDKDVVRLGLTPVRVLFVQGSSVDEATSSQPAMFDEEEEGTPIEEIGPASWHLVYVTDQGGIAAVTLDQKEQIVVAGEGPVEIQVKGRGLKPEHLQFDWSKNGLEVLQARRDALLKVNNNPVTAAPLSAGDAVSTGSVTIRVVRSAQLPTPLSTETNELWAKLFRKADPAIEVLFVEPDDDGGRVELTIWGDGAAQVAQHSGATHETFGATLTPGFLKLLFGALVRAGYPDSGRRQPTGAYPELYAFWGEERAEATITDRLLDNDPAWVEVRDLLCAITDSVLK